MSSGGLIFYMHASQVGESLTMTPLYGIESVSYFPMFQSQLCALSVCSMQGKTMKQQAKTQKCYVKGSSEKR